jgi:rhodanese-related sulfurtransferase
MDDTSAIESSSLRRLLVSGHEVALLDVREEDPYAQEHPLWAANLPLSTLELQAWTRIPRRTTLIAVYGSPDGVDALTAVRVLRGLGYSDVRLLAGGLAGWVASGGEVFRDVNAPSKAFGELVAAVRHTPLLPPEELRQLLDERADLVVLDARRYDEFTTMSVPTARSVPGGELVLRVRAAAPDPATRVVVNCAGRTRSIIGAQSLINAGVPNPVVALRNGTIGWTLAGQQLDHGVTTGPPALDPDDPQQAVTAGRAQALAEQAGAVLVGLGDLARLTTPDRTTYLFDVRTATEFEAGHLLGARHAPGGQLVQETDHSAPVRGARIVLVDDDGVRAAMTGSWLAQMGWDVSVLAAVPAGSLTETGPAPRALPPLPVVREATVDELRADGVVVFDVGPSNAYRAAHIDGAWHTSRSQLAEALRTVPAERYVVTASDDALARFAASDLQKLTSSPVAVFPGGTSAARHAGLAVTAERPQFAAPVIDRYRRPYEGTDNAVAAMEGYLEWEYGLVAQLERDATHRFHVI